MVGSLSCARPFRDRRYAGCGSRLRKFILSTSGLEGVPGYVEFDGGALIREDNAERFRRDSQAANAQLRGRQNDDLLLSYPIVDGTERGDQSTSLGECVFPARARADRRATLPILETNAIPNGALVRPLVLPARFSRLTNRGRQGHSYGMYRFQGRIPLIGIAPTRFPRQEPSTPPTNMRTNEYLCRLAIA